MQYYIYYYCTYTRIGAALYIYSIKPHLPLLYRGLDAQAGGWSYVSSYYDSIYQVVYTIST